MSLHQLRLQEEEELDLIAGFVALLLNFDLSSIYQSFFNNI